MNQNSSLEVFNPNWVSTLTGKFIDSVVGNYCRDKSLATLARFVLLCTISLLGFSPLHLHAQNETPAVLKQLTEFTESLKSFSADFTQVVYDADSNPVQQSAGDVLLKRPGRFIWNYTSPSPQKIIADGENVWLYDIELEQVTVSPLAEQGAGTPLALLMGEKPLEQEFELKPLGQSDGIDWVELKPKSSDSDFELVYLGLKGGGLAAMELRDGFGQATQIRFTAFKPGININDDDFRFVPPKGVDVIGNG